MYVKNLTASVCSLAALLFLFSCKKEINTTNDATSIAEQTAAARQIGPGTVTVFATGLLNPRGLEFGPDGNLYVAEAGAGGAPSPVGGRVSMINAAGARTTVTTNLPTTVQEGSATGPMDLTFLDGNLYVLTNGGASYGVPSKPSGIYSVNRTTGATALVANLSMWQQSHPVADPPEDFAPDGSWYNLAAVRNNLYALDANHSELVKATTDGSVSRVVDFTATQGHLVPTGMDYRGNFYVGNLGTFPIAPGTQKILKVSPDGSIETKATGYSAIMSLAIDQQSRMYVLEMGENPFSFMMPAQGILYGVSPNGERTVVAAGLNFPTGLTIGPDGNLYVSVNGFGPAGMNGMIMKVAL